MRPLLLLRSAAAVALAAAVYLVVAGIAGVVAGDGPGAPAAALTATAAAAAAYPPLRLRVHRWWVDRFGPALADRYERLAGLQSALSDLGTGSEALASVEDVLAAATGSRQARVDLPVVCGTSIGAAGVPHAADGALMRIAEPPDGGADNGDGWLRWLLLAAGGQVGTIELERPALDPEVAADLVQAALPTVTRLGLEARLRDRAIALVSARQQLVAAHDQRMVQLERHLHDIVQQELLAVGVKLGLAAAVAGPGTPRLAEGLQSAAATARAATAAVRAVSHGVHPPVLAARGLGPALASTARDTGIPLNITSDATARLPTAIESALFAAGRAVLATNPGGLSGSITVDGSHAELVLQPTTPPLHLDDVLVRDRVGAIGGTIQRTPETLTITVPTTEAVGMAGATRLKHQADKDPPTQRSR